MAILRVTRGYQGHTHHQPPGKQPRRKRSDDLEAGQGEGSDGSEHESADDRPSRGKRGPPAPGVPLFKKR